MFYIAVLGKVNLTFSMQVRIEISCCQQYISTHFVFTWLLVRFCIEFLIKYQAAVLLQM